MQYLYNQPQTTQWFNDHGFRYYQRAPHLCFARVVRTDELPWSVPSGYGGTLNAQAGDWVVWDIPADLWKYDEQRAQVDFLGCQHFLTVPNVIQFHPEIKLPRFVSPEIFARTYMLDDRYSYSIYSVASKTGVWAKQLTDLTQIISRESNDGGEVYPAGDWVCCGIPEWGDWYGMKNEEFQKRYRVEVENV